MRTIAQFRKIWATLTAQNTFLSLAWGCFIRIGCHLVQADSNNDGTIRGKKVVERMASGMPTHPSDKRLCPVCDGHVGQKHQYILQCPRLKTMSSKEARTLYHNMGSTCQKCYSKRHSTECCNLQNIMCRAQISTGHRKGQVCGSLMHHSSLHSDAKAKREAFAKMGNRIVESTGSK